MEGLQRSAVSFRRQGSSGLIWDDKFLSEVMNQAQAQAQADQKEETDKIQIQPPPPPAADEQERVKDEEVKPSTPTPVGSIDTIQRSRSNGGGRGFRTGKVSPAIEPPSPKFSTCGFCTAFGKPNKTRRRAKSGKRRT
ncbi:hypothetical protein LguiB_008245 [Lonicera macranthoides]